VENAYVNKVFFKDARKMSEIPDNSIHLIVTSPPYFNIKDYSKDGYQKNQISDKKKEQIGDIQDYKKYIDELLQKNLKEILWDMRLWKPTNLLLKKN
jgi:site-specific DNA-methyltransferase (cytosine-N4-specific)